ncbi:hypothetical protein GPECTOR_39g472 [Gonium pectorale]|uniref:Uncharacterized protein n=1 Tax=Gonium pectorale TaxID=33097 RepID=A0A150GAY5_GONPE|nr:hypothetical protein GPECTOR_39g472 [Gonium pectorale]|eukprot:KXZ46978.1 hypothetical protein GPECTOR_39g472 [Gonium pectorale]
MASELSRLIEDELKNKGFYEGKGQPEPEHDDEEAPHQALMGALRVEARVKEHQHQKKLLTLKRSICVGGGLILVVVLWVLIAVKSKSASYQRVDPSPNNATGQEEEPDSSEPPVLEEGNPPPPSNEELEKEFEKAVEDYEEGNSEEEGMSADESDKSSGEESGEEGGDEEGGDYTDFELQDDTSATGDSQDESGR